MSDSSPIDVSSAIVPKSDQLNGDDLIGGSIVVQITGVSKKPEAGAEQPIEVRITGHRPWRPCKSMLRVMVSAWGVDASRWVGQWVRLYRDEGVKWAGQAVGGIRIEALSGIDQGGISLAITERRGDKKIRRFEYLDPPKVPTLPEVLRANGLTDDQVNAWLVAQNKPPMSEMDDQKKSALAGWLANNPNRVAEIKGE
jgi:hypothetical protein